MIWLVKYIVPKVNAKSHTQLLAVGAWSLLETVARLCGANETTAFNHFFSKSWMTQNGIAKRKGGAAVDALDRLSRGGNTTKHDAISAVFDYRQLINDMETVSAIMAKALNDKIS